MIISPVKCFVASFLEFSSCNNPFFVVVHFAITNFFIVSLILVGTWFFCLDSLVTVFLDMSDFFAVVKFWYNLVSYLCQKSFPLWLYFPKVVQVPLCWYLMQCCFSSSLECYISDCTFILLYFSKILSRILLMVRGLL